MDHANISDRSVWIDGYPGQSPEHASTTNASTDNRIQPHYCDRPLAPSNWSQQEVTFYMKQELQAKKNSHLVVTIDQYILYVGQVESRLAQCLYDLARILGDLAVFLEAGCLKPGERGEAEDTILDRLNRPLLKRLADSRFSTGGLYAMKQLWDGFLSWGASNYRSSIAKEQKQCDDPVSS